MSARPSRRRPARPAHHSRLARDRDAGVTLAELLVAMGVTSIALTLIAGSFIAMFRATTKAELISGGASSTATAFNRLDQSVRYAAAISEPGVGRDGNWYVEWSGAVPDAADCTQLRLDENSRQLQQRTWDLDGSAQPVDVSSWLPLANELQTAFAPNDRRGRPVVEPPFTLGNDTASPHQQLRVHLISTAEPADADNPAATTSAFDVTFTALNSQSSTDSTSICRQVARS